MTISIIIANSYLPFRSRNRTKLRSNSMWRRIGANHDGVESPRGGRQRSWRSSVLCKTKILGDHSYSVVRYALCLYSSPLSIPSHSLPIFSSSPNCFPGSSNLTVSEAPDIGGEWGGTLPANQNRQISRLHRDVLIGAESAPPLPQNAV